MAQARVVFTHVTVIDGRDAPPQPNMSVVVLGDRIESIGPSSAKGTYRGALVVDGKGKYLIPGLWDMHVHLFGYGAKSFPLFLANGVTSIRELGGDLEVNLRLRRDVRQRKVLGPRLLIAGPTLDAELIVRGVRGTIFEKGRFAVPDPATARRIVDSLARRGVDLFKVHSLTPRGAYFAILEEARKHHLFVAGHLPDSVPPRLAIASGQRTIEHDFRVAIANSPRGEDLSRNLLARIQSYIDSAGAKADYLRLFQMRIEADDSARVAFDSATAATFALWAASQPVWFDPTLVVLWAMLRNNEAAIRNLPELKYVPREARNTEDGLPPKANPTAADIAEGQGEYQRVLTTFAPLIRAGAKFVTGTDVPVVPLVPGFSLQRELGLLVEAGLTPSGAIQAATHNSAEAAGKLAEVGTIAVGKRADLVLLSANPLEDIANTQRIAGVMIAGRWLDRLRLDRMLAEAEADAKH